MAIAALPEGTLLAHGRYRLTSVLARSNFSITYHARDLRDGGTEVVIKEHACSDACYRDTSTWAVLPHPDREELHAHLIERVMREATLLLDVRHPHVVGVDGAWEERGTAYVAMELVPGRTLEDDVLAAAALPLDAARWARVRRIALQVLGALDAAHAHGVYHCDLKPENVLVSPGRGAVLIDFGAARTEGQRLRAATLMPHTPGYAPPELLSASRLHEVGPCTDAYAWGMLVYGLATGHPGHGAPLDASRRLVRRSFSDLADADADPYDHATELLLERGMPEPWAVTLGACLHLDPTERPPTVAVLAERLCESLDLQSLAFTPPPPSTALARDAHHRISQPTPSAPVAARSNHALAHETPVPQRHALHETPVPQRHSAPDPTPHQRHSAPEFPAHHRASAPLLARDPAATPEPPSPYARPGSTQILQDASPDFSAPLPPTLPPPPDLSPTELPLPALPPTLPPPPRFGRTPLILGALSLLVGGALGARFLRTPSDSGAPSPPTEWSPPEQTLTSHPPPEQEPLAPITHSSRCEDGKFECNGDCKWIHDPTFGCGRCRPACRLDHADEHACKGAQCIPKRCAAGWADCDGKPANGCETDTRTDGANCGACGQSCAKSPGVTAAVCEASACKVTRCAPGHDDCDGYFANGCETDLRESKEHCGACGNACTPGPGVVDAFCKAATCRVGKCMPGRADCDLQVDNGCETDLASDPANCGACGRSCAPGLGVASVVCVSGQCRIGACSAERLACGGTGENGCTCAFASPPDADVESDASPDLPPLPPPAPFPPFRGGRYR
ncbi:protein kinase domain-containing protein [Chondromyces crocatus]|uniref:Protein kinase domain-containing protein n=1 Tax=Chondromyces crocatus TaxID=52 RepID=A0A0K1ES00_CHOCO|nr:protein kinase [Chondromyces crocatus]AKT43705.1 uncharacterized protein CMC5_079400 [Chondromyces crocatus]